MTLREAELAMARELRRAAELLEREESPERVATAVQEAGSARRLAEENVFNLTYLLQCIARNVS